MARYEKIKLGNAKTGGQGANWKVEAHVLVSEGDGYAREVFERDLKRVSRKVKK